MARFPEDFMFQLTEEEWGGILSQNVMTSISKRPKSENILRDQNDINTDTAMQLELINQTLAELRAKPQAKPRRPIGFDT